MTSRRHLSIGTTSRFLLLLALIAASSVEQLYDITGRDRSRALAKEVDCLTASGAFPMPVSRAAHAMYRRCMEGQKDVLNPVRQQTLLALLVLATVALAIYVLLPTWKRRRRRLAPLDVPLDGDTTDPLLAELAELRDRTGVAAHRVRFMLDPYDRSCSAVVFGRFGRNTISLNAGLVSRYAAGRTKELADDPAGENNAVLEAFRGAVLHELNHVANRDVGLTYATIAAWRAFLLVALVPALALTIGPDFDLVDAGDASVLQDVWFLTEIAGSVAAVYLMRADILRVREYHADALPPEWQADVRRLLATGTGDKRRLWHVHPSAAARRRMLDDPAQLLRTNLVPIGLAGVIAALIANQAGVGLVGIATPTMWLTAILLLTTVAALISRAAAYAADHGTPYPRGWREGAALGTGLTAGYLLELPERSGFWLPQSRPWLLLILFAGAVVGGVWMAQLASLSARHLPTRLLLPGLLAGYLTTVLAFGAPLVDFFTNGTRGVIGVPSLGEFGGVISHDRWLPLPRPAALLLNGSAYLLSNAAAVAGAALAWLVPTTLLIASLLRPRGRLRPGVRVLLLGFGGAIGALVAVAVTNGLWHHDLLRSGTGETDWWLYEAWLMAGLIAASAMVAAIAIAVLPGPTVPYAVTAGGITLLLGAFVTAVLWQADGCLGPLNVQISVCTTPAFGPQMLAVLKPLRQTLVIGLLSTIGVAVAASAVRDLARHALHRSARPRTPAVRTFAPSPKAAIVLAVMVLALSAWTILPGALMTTPATGGTADRPQLPGFTPVRTQAWLDAGGSDIVRGLLKEQISLIRLLQRAAALPQLTDDASAGETVAIYIANAQVIADGAAACRRLSAVAARAERFIPIPDTAAQSVWTLLYTAARSDGDRCGRDLVPLKMTIIDAVNGLPPVRLTDRLLGRLKQVGAQ